MEIAIKYQIFQLCAANIYDVMIDYMWLIYGKSFAICLCRLMTVQWKSP